MLDDDALVAEICDSAASRLEANWLRPEASKADEAEVEADDVEELDVEELDESESDDRRRINCRSVDCEVPLTDKDMVPPNPGG